MRTKNLYFILSISCLAYIAFFSGTLHAMPFYVDIGGSNSTGNGSSANPWRTLDFGIEQLNAGDTLYVKAGTYEPVVVNDLHGTAASPITIKSFDNDVVTVDGKNRRHAMYFGRSSHIIIDGFQLTDSDSLVDQAVGLNPDNAADKATLNSIVSQTGNGIKFSESQHMTIQNSDIFHTGSHGVIGVDSDNISVLGNTIHTGIKGISSYGVYLRNVANIIAGNTIYNNTGYGLHLNPSLVYSTIENNVIYDNGGEAWLHVTSQNKKVGGGNMIIYGGGRQHRSKQHSLLFIRLQE